ncbi:MAG: hypothetical protein AB1772_06030 [Candidatus Zixiibacteriota bacterium]
MTELKPLSSFPPIARLFIGLFTTLMLLVCAWAVWIYSVEKGEVDQSLLNPPLTPEAEIEVISSDSSAVLAPIWDSEHAGLALPLDSGEIDTMEDLSDLVEGYDGVGDDNEYREEPENRFRHNLGLAHVHVNGQTLLFFALGAVFLFTSVKLALKKTVLWSFAIMILAHTIGLTGEGFHWIYDDLLALSGVLLLALVAYMCLMIYVDLARSPRDST